MKILVLGASGMAGHTISYYFIDNGHDVATFSRLPLAFGKNIQGDALDREFIKSLVLNKKYDAIINCIGVLNKDCDRHPSEAIYLNSYLPHYISDLIWDHDTKFIQMSTDCVFSGKIGSYTENSLPDGESLYDKTKTLGELNDVKNLTFRTSIIGPDIKPEGIGLFNWFMQQSGTINGFTNAIWTGVSTITLARAMEKAIKENLSGLYHLVNNTTISKYDLLNLFNKYFREKKLHINPIDSIKIDKSLFNTRTDFTFNVPSYEEMLLEMKIWIKEHKTLYPNYKFF